MSLFNPDPDAPFWASAVPSDDDLDKATPEQRELWLQLNAEIATIHSSWAALESNLGALLAAILRIKTAQAYVILATLTSHRTKRQLIANTARVTLSSPSRRKHIERLLRRAAKVATKRNFLAHGIASYHQKYPDRVTVVGMAADLEPALMHYQAYRMVDLRRIRDTIIKLSGDIFVATGPVWRARREPLPETRPQRRGGDPALIGNRPPPQSEKP